MKLSYEINGVTYILTGVSGGVGVYKKLEDK